MEETPYVVTVVRRFANQAEALAWLAANELGPNDVAGITPAAVYDADDPDGAPNA